MKKFLVIMVVVAMTAFSSVAMADITFDGSIEFLMRSMKNLKDFNDKGANIDTDTYRVTYERVRLGVNAKNDGVKGRIQLDTDWDRWADGAGTASPLVGNGPNPGFETRTDGKLAFREAWVDFNMPFGVPGHVKVGRQLLQLGNGWFFRSMKYGSDAWLIGFPGKNTFAFVNTKASENAYNQADDTDAYVLLDIYKIDDNNSVGAYIAHVKDRKGVWTMNALGATDVAETTLDDFAVHYAGKVGPINLKAQIDLQKGEIKSANVADPKTKLQGNQFVIEAGMNMDALAINAIIGSGTGDKATTVGPDTKNEAFLPFLDADPRYSMVYEYMIGTANGKKGLSNTQVIGIGAMFKINKMFSVGADYFMLTANEKMSKFQDATLYGSDDIGSEIDVKLNVTLYDQLTWNTWYGVFMPGKVYDITDAVTGMPKSADNASGFQSVLSYKF